MMEQRLQSGLAALNLPVEGIPALVRYGDLLIETNKVMNLTAITDPEDVATLHFLDSAALLTLESFSGKSVVDVGTGAGFPGLPLRVLEPSIRLTLLDSLNKRIQFLETDILGSQLSLQFLDTLGLCHQLLSQGLHSPLQLGRVIITVLQHGLQFGNLLLVLFHLLTDKLNIRRNLLLGIQRAFCHSTTLQIHTALCCINLAKSL